MMIVSLIEPSVLRLRAVWGFCCVDGLRMVVIATAEPGYHPTSNFKSLLAFLSL